MYMDMELWGRVRHKVLVEGQPKRQVMREEGLAWDTLKKILAHSAPPGYRQKRERRKRKLGEHWDWMEQVLAGDKQVPRKQRHTAKRLWDRLKAERGFRDGYTAVKEAVRELSRRSQEVFMPLSHRPGTMQMDFGQALARIQPSDQLCPSDQQHGFAGASPAEYQPMFCTNIAGEALLLFVQ